MSDTAVNRCLLIDDNAVDRFVHRKLLSHHKVAEDIVEISGGKEALDYLQSTLEGLEPVPELILLDLMMPEMDGFEFMRHYSLWAAKVDNPPSLFMVSSTEDHRDIKRARENQHIKRLLRKPLMPEILLSYLRS